MARSILITGSSHGIGAGCAIAFARDEQANIGICGNKNPEGAQEIARQCEVITPPAYTAELPGTDVNAAPMPPPVQLSAVAIRLPFNALITSQ